MPQRQSPVVRVVVAILLISPFVAYLAVPSYAKVKPRLAGFPFFYWWQLLWVIITAVFIGIAYLLTRRRPESATPADQGGE
jgi:putative exporter of polyketide antibiotics